MDLDAPIACSVDAVTNQLMWNLQECGITIKKMAVVFTIKQVHLNGCFSMVIFKYSDFNAILKEFLQIG